MPVILFGLSMGEIMLIFLVVLMLFGSRKIPDLARSMGKGFREFRRAADDIKREFEGETIEVREEIYTLQNNIRDELNAPGTLVGDFLDDNSTGDDPGKANSNPPGQTPKIVDIGEDGKVISSPQSNNFPANNQDIVADPGRSGNQKNDPGQPR